MNNDLMFYLAGPYSHKSKKIMKERELVLTKLAGLLHNHDITVYSPITHSARIAKIMGWKDTNFAKYEKDDLNILERCDGLIVLQMEGWEQSQGVTAEILYADDLDDNKYNFHFPIFYLEYPYDLVDISLLLNDIHELKTRHHYEGYGL